MDIKQTFIAGIKKKISQKALVGLIMLFPSTGFALPAEWPVEFEATYSLETYGITAAKATYVLQHKANGIKFTQNSQTVGFASLFSKETLQETSLLSLHNEQLLLDEYSYIQKGSDKNRDVILKIKWDATDENNLTGTINGTAEGTPVNHEVKKPIWDTLSFQIPIMMSTNKKTSDWEAALLVKGHPKKYFFVTHGTEEVTVSGNTLKTIKVERKSKNNDKPIFFWIAPDLFNLPVKIEKWKKGKAHITMFLNSASFPSDKKVQFKSADEFNDQ